MAGLFDDIPDAKPAGLFDDIPDAQPSMAERAYNSASPYIPEYVKEGTRSLYEGARDRLPKLGNEYLGRVNNSSGSDELGLVSSLDPIAAATSGEANFGTPFDAVRTIYGQLFVPNGSEADPDRYYNAERAFQERSATANPETARTMGAAMEALTNHPYGMAGHMEALEQRLSTPAELDAFRRKARETNPFAQYTENARAADTIQNSDRLLEDQRGRGEPQPAASKASDIPEDMRRYFEEEQRNPAVPKAGLFDDIPSVAPEAAGEPQAAETQQPAMGGIPGRTGTPFWHEPSGPQINMPAPSAPAFNVGDLVHPLSEDGSRVLPSAVRIARVIPDPKQGDWVQLEGQNGFWPAKQLEQAAGGLFDDIPNRAPEATGEPQAGETQQPATVAPSASNQLYALSGQQDLPANQPRTPTEVKVYHGTTADFEKFSDMGRGAVFLAGDPEYANEYAEGFVRGERVPGSRVIPGWLETENFKTIDINGNQRAWAHLERYARQAKEEGFNGVILKNVVDPDLGHNPQPHTEYMASTPGTIRSSLSDHQLYALSGFHHGPEEAVQSFPQPRATPEQWRKVIEARPGWKDYVETTGLDDFLAGKKAITKDELLGYMRAHSADLDEKVLDSSKENEINKAKLDLRNSEDQLSSLEDARKYYQQNAAGSTIIERKLADLTKEIEAKQAELAERRNGVDAISKDYAPSKFEAHKIPGGVPGSYRELLIRDPSLEGKRLSPDESARSGKIQDQINEILRRPDYNRIGGMEKFADRLDKLQEEKAALDEKSTPKYTSKHFSDQEIAHIRFDDRVGSNGEKVMFLHEVQSDLHQKGRTEGYKSPESDKAKAELEAEIDALRERSRQLDEQIEKARSRGRRGEDELDRLRNEQAQVERRIQRTHYSKQDLVPPAPFKGDLWLELALKRSLRYAVEHGYDAISWARSDQIAKAVDAPNISHISWKITKDGLEYKTNISDKPITVKAAPNGEPYKSFSDLLGKRVSPDVSSKFKEAVSAGKSSGELSGFDVVNFGMQRQYDEAMRSFLDKYAKKWGAKVERENVTESEELRRKRSDLQARIEYAENSLGAGRNQRIAANVRDEARAELEKLKEIDRTTNTNPILRITPQMRESVLKGQAYARNAETGADPRFIQQKIRGDIEAGRTSKIDPQVIRESHAAIKPYGNEAPKNTPIGTITDIKPIKGGTYVQFNFRSPDGKTFSLVEPKSRLFNNRAVFLPNTRAIAIFDFGDAIGANPESGVKSLGGRIRHEVVHALRADGSFTGSEWGFLVGHANALRILDQSGRDFFRLVGDPFWRNAAEGKTLRDYYEPVYSSRGDNFQELMDQEGVAHMAEIYHHALMRPEGDPFREGITSAFADAIPMLEKMFSGEIAKRTPGEVIRLNRKDQAYAASGEGNKQAYALSGGSGAENLAKAGRPAAKQAIALAERLEKTGADRDEIWRKTARFLKNREPNLIGVYRGVDGKWRFEVDDSAAKVRSYNLTPKEAYDEVAHNAVVDRHPFDIQRRDMIKPLQDLSQEDVLSRWKEYGQKIIDAAKSGNKELASRLIDERQPLDTMLTAMADRKYGPLSSFVDHPNLYEAHPQVGELHTRIDPDLDARGQYFPGDRTRSEQFALKELSPYYSDNKGTALHEAQHKIQRDEDFSRGENPDNPRLQLPYNALRKQTAESGAVLKIHNRVDFLGESPSEAADWVAKSEGHDPDRLFRLYNEYTPDEMTARFHESSRQAREADPNEVYHRTAGEVEARNVQKRMKMTPEERRASPPWETQDVPEDQQIIRYGNKGPQYSISGGSGGAGGKPPAAGKPSPSPMGPDRLPQTALGRKFSAAIDKAPILNDLMRGLQMMTAPMTARDAHPVALAAAKDFANTQRLIAVDHNQIDKMLGKNFTPAERKLMFEAMDQESVNLQRGSHIDGQGVDRLNERQRAVTDALSARNDAELPAALAQNVITDEFHALPSYVPRMIVQMTGGEFTNARSGSGGAPRLDPLGNNVKTTSPHLKKRKYETVAETESAAKTKFGDTAKVVRDIRTLPLATARLQEAIAGKTLINEIKRFGQEIGEQTVSVGGIPEHSPHTWFTIDAPAFYEWKPKVEKNADGKWELQKYEDGTPVFERQPLYIRSDWEGPLRAVLSSKGAADVVLRGLTAIKSKGVGYIMFSPLAHNLVIWGKALPAMPLKEWFTLGYGVYRQGNRVKNDPAMMRRAVQHGLAPIGKYGFRQDVSGLMTEARPEGGETAESRAIGWMAGLFNKNAGKKVTRAIDAAENFKQNTLLWDRIADLQFGLWKTFTDGLQKKGLSQEVADRVAADFANRYAGSLPQEFSSKMARIAANILFFSRSFTFSNLASIGDMFTGLGKGTQAQILRSGGEQALRKARGLARDKAFKMVLNDILMMYVTLSVLQSIANSIWGAIDDNGYEKRVGDVMKEALKNPLSLIQAPANLSATAENEEGKEGRIYAGKDAQGTALYARPPMGKVAEEMINWMIHPSRIIYNKEAPLIHAWSEGFSNDIGFGRHLYNPNPKTTAEYAEIAATFVGHMAKSMVPADALEALYHVGHGAITGEGNAVDFNADARVLGGFLSGVPFSKGAPGGPEQGAIYKEQDRYKFQIEQAKPKLKRLLRDGKDDEANQIFDDIKATPQDRAAIRKGAVNPHVSPRARSNFNRRATDEEKEKFDSYSRQ